MTDGGTLWFSGEPFEHFNFAVLGDTRPACPDETAGYPTDIITKIYADVAAITPAPQFVIATGDFMDANPQNDQQQPQLDLYMTAAHQYKGPIFPVMGNHECGGNTDSNCTPESGSTANFRTFMQTLVAPVGSQLPYYTVDFEASDKSWTAKLVVMACNAWDATQLAWVEAQLSRTTTYTLIARHEEMNADSNPPCLPQADALLTQYPYDVLIVGHSHTFATYVKQLTVGTGGAPLASGSTYGYAVVQEQGGNFTATQYDYQSAGPLRSYTFPH
jgi:predicted phosphodiesterase